MHRYLQVTGDLVPYDRENFYTVSFRPRRTRQQYHALPRKGQGRVRYQVNVQLEGFRKGDVVRVKGKHIKQINSMYSNGYLAFPRVKGAPIKTAEPRTVTCLNVNKRLYGKRSCRRETALFHELVDAARDSNVS